MTFSDFQTLAERDRVQDEIFVSSCQDLFDQGYDDGKWGWMPQSNEPNYLRGFRQAEEDLRRMTENNNQGDDEF